MEARLLKTSYTEEDYYNTAEDERIELIDGQIYNLASPSRTHQELTGELFGRIREYIKSKGGPCKVYAAPFAVKLNEDDKTIVEPDISVICDRDKLTEKGCHGAPDWIIEIVSPSTSSRDYILKFNKYLAAGVREYWIVDHASQAIAVYFFAVGSTARLYTFSEKIKVRIWDDFYIDFNDIDLS